jgi:hypothetical protein
MCVCIYRKKFLQHSFVNVLIVILSKCLIIFFYIIELHINIKQNKTGIECLNVNSFIKNQTIPFIKLKIGCFLPILANCYLLLKYRIHF